MNEYVDRGVSGAKERRPFLDELMLDVTKGRRDFQAVLVWKFDRFARSVQHLLKALGIFNENDVAFISLTESVDTSMSGGWPSHVRFRAYTDQAETIGLSRRNGERTALDARPMGTQ